MPRKRTFRCSKCDRTFILESSFDEHNFRGIHDPMKPRGGIRKNAGGSRKNAGGSRKNAGRQLGNSGGPRDNAGGSRENSGPTEDLTDEVINQFNRLKKSMFSY